MDGYLVKPIQPDKLWAALEQISAAAPPPEVAAENPRSAAAVWDRDALLLRLNGDEQFMASIVSLFLEDTGARMADLRDAVARRDATAVQKSAQAVKGALANVGAEEAFQCAACVESVARGMLLSELD